MLKSKLHRVTVTDVNIQYEGSLEVDQELLALADIRKGEQVHVYNVTNGNRFVTYAVEGPAGERQIRVLGAAGRLVAKGDIILIVTYADYDETELPNYQATVIQFAAGNEPKYNHASNA